MLKSPKDSKIIMTELVLPNDTNVFGNLMGGRLMYWMDIAAALCAGKHCNTPVVTASVDNISFENPIKLGNAVHIHASHQPCFYNFHGSAHESVGRGFYQPAEI